jgi:hypothetical protein
MAVATDVFRVLKPGGTPVARADHPHSAPRSKGRPFPARPIRPVRGVWTRSLVCGEYPRQQEGSLPCDKPRNG